MTECADLIVDLLAPEALLLTCTPLQDAHNLLRPETVESLFVLWRVTGDARYREWGWHMFRAWHRFCRVPTGGFANLESVLTVRAAAQAAQPDPVLIHLPHARLLWGFYLV